MPNRTDDNDLIAQYRARFRRGPVGLWTTWLGAGWDICYGCQFEFASDFSGRVCSWDSGDEDEPEMETPFTWRLLDDFVIETQPIDESDCEEAWGVVRYDFRFALSKYGGDRMLVLYEVGDGDEDTSGFWWSPNPVMLVEGIAGQNRISLGGNDQMKP